MSVYENTVANLHVNNYELKFYSVKVSKSHKHIHIHQNSE